MHKVLITGGRGYLPREQIGADLDELVATHKGHKILIIHGAEPTGVDALAGSLARERGIHTASIPALWKSYGRASGPIRNGIMLALEPDEAFAYHPNIDESRGTADMVAKLRKAGIPVTIREANAPLSRT